MSTNRMLLVLAGSLLLLVTVQTEKQRLMILLLDGMRWDYLNRDYSNLKGFQRMAREGVLSTDVMPIFPSSSYPNWYTIATGLYGENHGIIDNFMYDSVRDDSFLMGPHPNVSHEHWWNKTEPLWINAEINGIRTSMDYWDGCQVAIHGVRPSMCQSYRPFWFSPEPLNDTGNRMVELLEWFEGNDDHRLAMVYYEGPDYAGHQYGPDAPETFKEIRKVDEMLAAFQEELDERSIGNQVNLMIVSDHGMADVRSSQLIELDDFEIADDIQHVLGDGAVASIMPKPGSEQKVYQRLKEKKAKGLNVYLKEEIPEHFRFKNGQVTLPILLLADFGYYITKPGSSIKEKPNYNGAHGFDPYGENTDMKTLALFKGPAFKKGVSVAQLQQTDHYNVFCYILGIRPQPNNGSWDRVSDLLVGLT